MAAGDFAGKRVLVGGGSAGMGLRIATRMAEQGAVVAVTGRNRERGEAAAAALAKTAPGSFYIEADFNRYEDAARAANEAAQTLGGIDILVSAGAQGSIGPKPFAEMTPEELQTALTTRVFPRMFAIHAALPHLKASKGSVVMLTTDAARHATPGESIVGASGAALMLLTKALAREFSRWLVRVNTVAMTLTSETVSWDRIFSKASFENRLFSKAVERFPAGRAPTADEVAEAVLFLASDRASQVTGQTLSVNGGLSFGGW